MLRRLTEGAVVGVLVWILLAWIGGYGIPTERGATAIFYIIFSCFSAFLGAVITCGLIEVGVIEDYKE